VNIAREGITAPFLAYTQGYTWTIAALQMPAWEQRNVGYQRVLRSTREYQPERILARILNTSQRIQKSTRKYQRAQRVLGVKIDKVPESTTILTESQSLLYEVEAREGRYTHYFMLTLLEKV
jgi:hypothetical protein